MEESNDEARVSAELYFLIAKFLSGGPLKETAKTLLKELESVEVLPRRLDWEGQEHTQSYDELSSQYTDMPYRRLVEVCQRALRLGGLGGLGGARLSLFSEGLVRPPPKYSPYTQDHSLVRRIAHRELGLGPSARVGGCGGKALVSPRLLSSLQLQRRTLGHLSAVYCLLFDCTGRYVVTGADDLLVKVWSARDGRLLRTLRGAGAEITDVCITSDAHLLAAGSVERAVRVWRLDTAAPVAMLTQHTGTITAVHWAPSKDNELRWLASTSTDGSVAFWTCSRSGQFLSQPVQYVERMRPGACHMICAAWSAGGAFLAAGSADHHVRLYMLEPGSSPRRVLETAAHTDAVDSLSWSLTGLRFVSGSKDGTAALWSLHCAQWRHTILRCEPINDTADNKKLKVTMVQWDASDEYIVTAVSDCSIRVWCSRTCTQIRVLTGHSDEAYVLEAHPYLPAVFLSAGHDGQLFVWDAHTGETLASFHNRIEGQGSGAIFDAKWGGDGTVVAASDSHGHLLLLGLGQGHKLYRKLPTELFFHTDYRPLARDALGGALDEQTETPPHLMPPPFLVDVEGAPHPPDLQRLVPGRENLTLSQLIPMTGDEPQSSQIDLLIEALRRRHDEDGGNHLNGLNASFDDEHRSVWRGSGVRRTLGSWQRGSPLHSTEELSPLMPPLTTSQRIEIEKKGSELYEAELSWYRREMRRRPLMISTAERRRPVARPRCRPKPSLIPRDEPEEPLEAETSGSDSSDCSVRLSRSASDSDDSSSQCGSKSDNSSSSKSSQYSDWEAGERLAPPARARRRPVQPTKRYSPSAVTPKRSERNATAAATPAPSVATTTVKELPEAYRPGEWLTAVTPRKAPYYPQMGDHCVYFKLGHQRYFEAVAEKDVYKINPKDKPWERTQIRDFERVKVVGIKYITMPPRVVCLRLARRGRSFTVKYHDMPDVIDFLVPLQQYKAACKRKWASGDRFRCMIDDSWWTGVIIESSAPPPPSDSDSDTDTDTDRSAAQFLCLRVRWDNGELERLSPWDLEPVDVNRLPAEPGGCVPVLSSELEAVLYKATADEWPPNGDRVTACSTIASHIEQVMSLSVAEPFVAPVDLQLYPSYALIVSYPIDLSTIKARFENFFYRRTAAAQFDVRYLASNAEQFNKMHSPIVRQARLVTDLMLYIISNWQDVDVVAKYHDLAANYHSSDEEVQPLSKHKSRRRRGSHTKPQSEWRVACNKLLTSLLASSDAQPFRAPVPAEEAPDYHSIVQNPMDLGTVSAKLENDEYNTQEEFAADVRLIFANSRLYNTNKRSRIYSMTVRLSALFAALWSRIPLRSRRTPRFNTALALQNGSPPAYPLLRRSSSSDTLAVTSLRARLRNTDSTDSQPNRSLRKGKGVGKKTRQPVSTYSEPSTSQQAEEETTQNGHRTPSPSASAVTGSRSATSHSEYSIEVLEEELAEDEVELTYDSGSDERRQSSRSQSSVRKRKRKPSSGSSVASRSRRRDRVRPQKRVRELVTEGTSSSSSSSGGECGSARRYESDRSYRPRYSSDDDAPLHLYRQRQEVNGDDGAGPSNPRRRHKKGRVRLRARRTPTRKYNEDSEEDSIAAISKRLRGAAAPRLAQLLADRRARQGAAPSAAHTTDHNYSNGHGRPHNGESSSQQEQPVSISSRGRVRKLTAKARGLLRE